MTRAASLLLVSSLAAAATVAVAQDRPARPSTSPAVNVPGIDTAGMDLSVRPQDDFFRYVNGRWVDTTPIPGDLSSYGTFAMLRERAQVAVRDAS